jgi:peroxiredoxin
MLSFVGVDPGSGVPAAFSGTCTQSHLPGYFKHLGELRQKGIQEIYVISVNDPFVMNAWKDSFGVDSSVILARDAIDGRFGSCRIHRVHGSRLHA